MSDVTLITEIDMAPYYRVPANKADAVSIVHRICMGLAVTKR